MADAVSSLTGLLPDKSSIANFGSGAVNVVTWILIILVFTGIIGLALYLFLRNLKFKKSIIVWEKVNNNWEITGRDKAMDVRFGSLGDAVIYLKKRKKYLPLPDIQVGRNVYWYAVGEDGVWHNVGMGDINLQLATAGVKIIHPSVRAFRTSMSKVLAKHYEKQPGFLQKYGALIISVAAIAIVLILLWFVADKLISGISAQGEAAKSISEAMKTADNVLAHIDNMMSNSGVKPTS